MGRDDLYEILGKHPKFRGVYKDLSMVETWLSNNCTPFPNGEKTKQIEKHEGLTVIPGKKKRVYCFPVTIVDGFFRWLVWSVINLA